ncbi:MAG: acyl-CoA thioesterase [Taibaiella sp.]|nr:acyl-CoA thioesterase [Taibaiella sp.]
MYEASTQVRVRYGETDQMGYVYYGNYALYYEEGRTSAIRFLGVTYKNLEEIGIMMPVMNINITYFRPAYYDELLTVKSTIRNLSKEDTEVTFHSEIYNEAGKKLNESSIRLAFVDAATRRKTRVPELLYDQLRGFFE